MIISNELQLKAVMVDGRGPTSSTETLHLLLLLDKDVNIYFHFVPLFFFLLILSSLSFVSLSFLSSLFRFFFFFFCFFLFSLISSNFYLIRTCHLSLVSNKFIQSIFLQLIPLHLYRPRCACCVSFLFFTTNSFLFLNQSMTKEIYVPFFHDLCLAGPIPVEFWFLRERGRRGKWRRLGRYF